MADIRRTVLVADDDENLRLLVRATLEGPRIVVVEAADGTAALSRLQEGDIDLAVLDWEMPGLTGLEIIQKLRECDDASVPPIIMLTARTTPKDRTDAVLLGIRGYLMKPFSPTQLLDLSEKVLEGH